jgi:hypothetical protein
MAVRRVLLVVLMAAILPAAAPAAPPVPAVPPRVGLVPMDDRPVNLSDVVAIGSLSGGEVVTPPRSRLGRGDAEGDGDGLAQWLDALDLAKVNAVVVSIDMLAYGGLPASRHPDITLEKALGRLKAIERLRARAGSVHVYAFATLAGQSLGDDGRKGAWRTALMRWAEIGGPEAADPQAAAEARSIEGQLPSTMIDRYKALRARNLTVARAAAELSASGTIDYLVLNVEDAEPHGIFAVERATVTAALGSALSSHRAAFVAGADRIATLLVARALAVPGRAVAVDVIPAAGAAKVEAALNESFDVVGVARPARGAGGDAHCVIYTGRDDGAAAGAAGETIAKALASGRRVAAADVGAAREGAAREGAAVPFIEALRVKHAFQKMAGFSAGDAPVAIARALAAAAIARDDAASRAAREQVLLQRLAVDFAYAAVVRPQAVDDYLEPHRIDPEHLDPDQARRTEAYLTDQLKPLVENLITDVSAARKLKPGPNAVRDVNEFTLKLLWGRLDDVEIGFTLTAQ